MGSSAGCGLEDLFTEVDSDSLQGIVANKSTLGNVYLGEQTFGLVDCKVPIELMIVLTSGDECFLSGRGGATKRVVL